MGRIIEKGSAGFSQAGPLGYRSGSLHRPDGRTDPAAKPLKGFGGASVMEIIDRHDTNTYRAVYTVQFADVIYVLHAFQKKSKRGIATPQKELDLIRRRLAEAQRLRRQRSN
jgi:phage-related protein